MNKDFRMMKLSTLLAQNIPATRVYTFVCSTVLVHQLDIQCLLLCVLAAGDEPEIKMHSTDLNNRKILREGL